MYPQKILKLKPTTHLKKFITQVPNPDLGPKTLQFYSKCLINLLRTLLNLLSLSIKSQPIQPSKSTPLQTHPIPQNPTPKVPSKSHI